MRLLTVVAAVVLASMLAPLPASAQTAHTCFGEPATIVGTPGDDDIRSDIDTDVVVGLAGVDRLGGRLVCGGKDGDGELVGFRVNGGPGDDWEIFLDTTGDLAIGGPGHDRFFDRGLAGEPTQVWRGGTGSDRLTMGGGPEDVFYGGAGNDMTTGGESAWSEKLRLFGGDDNDQLFGGLGKDKIYGQAGDDFLQANYYRFRPDTISDFIDGGEGFDTCILETGDRAVNCEDVIVD